jgi:hypothetical protein
MEVFLGVATDRVVDLGYNIFPSSAVSVNVGEGFIFEADLAFFPPNLLGHKDSRRQRVTGS